MSEFENISLNKRYMDLNVTEGFDGYSGVEIIVDDDVSYFSGSTNGRVLTIQNPWGTQKQADNIIDAIRGFQYQPYTAEGALLSPAAELGDGVSMNGLYSGLFKISRNYSSLMATNISAPQDEEIDHEYPFETKGNREITRKFMAVESEFTLQSNEIAAKVSKTSPDGQTSFSWVLDDDSWEVKSNGTTIFKVDNSGAAVRGVITATSGKIGNFNIGTNAIWNNIDNFNNSGNLSTGVYLGTNGIRLGKNFSVNTSGNITANNATLTGTLTIGGKSVTASDLGTGASGYWSGGGVAGTKFDNMTQSRGYPLWASSFRVDAGSRKGVQFTVQTIYFKDHAGNNRSAEVLASSIS